MRLDKEVGVKLGEGKAVAVNQTGEDDLVKVGCEKCFDYVRTWMASIIRRLDMKDVTM